MAKVSLEFTGDDKDLVASLRRMQAETVKLQEANAKIAQQAKAAAKDAKEHDKTVEGSVKNWVAGLSSVSAAYFAVQGAIKLVNFELERQKRLQEDVANRQLGVAGAERGYLSNLGGTATERQAANQELQRIARTRGVPLDQAYRSASAALGFTQGGIGSQANPPFDVAARFNPYDTEQLTFGLLAAQKLTGSSDAMSNLGFIKSVQDFSPISSTGLLAQNLIPGALGVKSIGGGTDIEAASLVNALSDVRVDLTGQESAGTAQRLARAAKTVFPHLTTDQAIAAAQKDPAAAKRIADKIDNSVTKAAAEQLLFNPNSEAAIAYRASKAGIAGADSRVSRAEAAIAANESTSLQGLGAMDRTLASGAEAMAMGNNPAGQAGVLRKRLGEVAQQANVGYLNETFATFGYDFSLFRTGDQFAAFDQSAQYLQGRARQQGNDEGAALLGELIREVRAMRTEQPANLNGALRQNSVNDLDRHTEGR